MELSEPSGKRRQVKKGGFATGRDAAEACAEVLRQHRDGHSKISLTSDTYGHLIGTVGKSAAEAAAAVVPRRRAG